MLLASSLVAPPAAAQTFFYNEVVNDGRIYVFAASSRYDAFVKSGGAETGRVIERRAYGPNGETVVFDSETAINLYNFKHGLPGESFPEPDQPAASQFPSHKFSGLMFGDYYWYYDRHQDGISSADPSKVNPKSRNESSRYRSAGVFSICRRPQKPSSQSKVNVGWMPSVSFC